jgi:Annexin
MKEISRRTRSEQRLTKSATKVRIFIIIGDELDSPVDTKNPPLAVFVCVRLDLYVFSFLTLYAFLCTHHNTVHDACKGFGTNEKRLLKALGSQSAEHRCMVPIRYENLFGKNLKDTMKSECGKKPFGTVLQLLAVNPVEAECDMIDRACQGLGTNEVLLFTMLGGRSDKEMELLKRKFFELKTKDLGRVLDAELGGAYESLVFNVLQGAEETYDADFHTEEMMAEDAAALYEMGQGKMFGTNEAGMFKIFCARPPEYLKKMNLIYADKYGYTLTKAMETELRGQGETAALFMLGMKLKPYETVAKLINRACKGFGTNELLLTATLIRYQLIMNEVKEAHIELFGETIEDRVKSDCRGDYERILLEILGVSE